MGSALILSACGGDGGDGAGTAEVDNIYADCEANPNECNSVPADQLQDGGELSFAIEKNVPNWNIISSEGNVLESAFVLKGVLPYTFYTQPDFTVTMNEDLLVSAEQTSEDPQVIEYEIQPDAQWSDGTPITADDFIYNWKVQNGEDCPDCTPASTSGYDQVESVEGSEDGKTVTVTFEEPFTDWKVLWSSTGPMYPAHIAEENGGTDSPKGLGESFKWFGENVPEYSGGPYQIENFQDNESVTLTPNEQYWGEAPNLDRLIFRVITEASEQPTALQNNEVQVIYPQPQVDFVEQIDAMQGVSSHIGMGLTWEHFDFNLKNEFLSDEPLRDALFTAVDRQGIIDKTVGQFTDKVEPLNSHNFVPGQDGYEDVVSEFGHGSGDVEAAKQILTDAGYELSGGKLTTPDGETVPEMRIRYTTGNEIRQNECELFAQAAKELGVTVNVEPTDDLGGTLVEGDYDIIVFAWVSSPFPYSGAVQLWTSDSGSNFGGYKNDEVDKLLREAASETDASVATEKLNEADKIMSEDAYVLPLYQKPTFIATHNNVANVRNNSTLDGPLYNVAEWGLRQE
ncbi:ABC transporter family substrate-binding protein [Haloechinothrix salitolerans]|uniref:ABC transporter family substrate-binding protein n=1 Tax=Haloechinothrix salitolerans TaxID=926830 RepID=A0ABW2BZB8_9PSEU